MKDTVHLSFELPRERYSYLKMMCAKESTTIEDFISKSLMNKIEDWICEHWIPEQESEKRKKKLDSLITTYDNSISREEKEKEIQKLVNMPWSYTIEPDYDIFVAYVIELPGLYAEGNTPNEAVENVKDVIRNAVETHICERHKRLDEV